MSPPFFEPSRAHRLHADIGWLTERLHVLTEHCDCASERLLSRLYAHALDQRRRELDEICRATT